MRIPEGINFGEYIEAWALAESQEIHTAGHWEEHLVELARSGVRVWGDCLPWSKTHETVRLRPGELSIWAGMNGHKKSMLLGYVMLHIAKEHRVAIASLEMKPEQTLFRMARQSTGCAPSERAVRDFIGWADDKVLIYDQLDKVAQEKILGFAVYCAKELGCRHIVIDSLTKCGLSQGDHEAEKDFIDRLQWAAKTLGAHIHLVCHVRKPQNHGEDYVPNKFDVRGAGELTDLVDNVFIVWKDKRKEQLKKMLAGGASLGTKESDYIEKNADQRLIVAKQRHGEWEGQVNLYFHEASLQFLGSKNHAVIGVSA